MLSSERFSSITTTMCSIGARICGITVVLRVSQARRREQHRALRARNGLVAAWRIGTRAPERFDPRTKYLLRPTVEFHLPPRARSRGRSRTDNILPGIANANNCAQYIYYFGDDKTESGEHIPSFTRGREAYSRGGV